jgi:hypothetical protein
LATAFAPNCGGGVSSCVGFAANGTVNAEKHPCEINHLDEQQFA